MAWVKGVSIRVRVSNLIRCMHTSPPPPSRHALQWRHQHTPYDVLGVAHDASRQTVRSSFVRLSKLHHPDMRATQTRTNNNDESLTRWHEVHDAYTLLADDVARAAYDAELRARHTYPQQHTTHSTYTSGFAHTTNNARNTAQDSNIRTSAAASAARSVLNDPKRVRAVIAVVAVVVCAILVAVESARRSRNRAAERERAAWRVHAAMRALESARLAQVQRNNNNNNDHLHDVGVDDLMRTTDVSNDFDRVSDVAIANRAVAGALRSRTSGPA